MKMHMVNVDIRQVNVSMPTQFNLIDMRKPLSRDTKRETIRENGEKVLVHPEELEPWR